MIFSSFFFIVANGIKTKVGKTVMNWIELNRIAYLGIWISAEFLVYGIELNNYTNCWRDKGNETCAAVNVSW